MNLFDLHSTPEELVGYDVPYAITRTNGTSRDKVWFLNGKKHREDGPAVEWGDGEKEWWLHGVRHREDGPAVIEIIGKKEWWLHGKQHREDGPAIEYSGGDTEWYVNGKRHRTDGPAIDSGWKSYYINGEKVLPFKGEYKE